MKYEAIIFDFDGTLVISNQIKYETYFEVFMPYNIEAKLLIKVLKKWPELNRYETIKKIIEISNIKLNALSIAKRYSYIIQQKIYLAANLKYAVDLLDYLDRNHILLFLSSNTPKKYLNNLINNRGWTIYFKAIFGYPNSKAVSVRTILKDFELKPSKVLIIGDGTSDKESAIINNTDFILVKGNSLLPVIKKMGIKYKLSNQAILFIR